MESASAYADSFLALIQREWRDDRIPDEARGVSSVADLGDYADTDRYLRVVLADLASDPAAIAPVIAEIDRRLWCRGHHDEIPAPVTPLTGPHQLGFDVGFTHANALDGEIGAADSPDEDERQSGWSDDQWSTYTNGWLEGVAAWETYGGFGIASRLADGRYYECEHRPL